MIQHDKESRQLAIHGQMWLHDFSPTPFFPLIHATFYFVGSFAEKDMETLVPLCVRYRGWYYGHPNNDLLMPPPS